MRDIKWPVPHHHEWGELKFCECWDKGLNAFVYYSGPRVSVVTPALRRIKTFLSKDEHDFAVKESIKRGRMVRVMFNDIPFEGNV